MTKISHCRKQKGSILVSRKAGTSLMPISSYLQYMFTAILTAHFLGEILDDTPTFVYTRYFGN
jgi:hypothetical protein